VSDRLRKQVSLELEQIDRLLAAHRPLLEKCTHTTPDNIELSAAAAILHAFYTRGHKSATGICCSADLRPALQNRTPPTYGRGYTMAWRTYPRGLPCRQKPNCHAAIPGIRI